MRAAAKEKENLADFYQESASEITIALVATAAAFSRHYARSRLRPDQFDIFLFGMGALGYSVLLMSVVVLHNSLMVTGGVTLIVAAAIALIENREEDN